MRDHFAQLFALPLGTGVTLRWHNRLCRGRITGHRQRQGSEYVMVQTQADCARGQTGGLTHGVDLHHASDLQVADSACGDLPRNPTGRALPSRGGFLTTALGIPDPAEFIMASTHQLSIVGPVGAICAEASDKHFSACANGGRAAFGALGELLRLKSLVGGGQPYRTQLLPHSVRRLPAGHALQPLVFDGARGYLKCRHMWPGADWLVLLDRTDRLFEDAAAQLNADYQRRGPDEGSEAPDSDHPAGVEMLAYADRTDG